MDTKRHILISLFAHSVSKTLAWSNLWIYWFHLLALKGFWATWVKKVTMAFFWHTTACALPGTGGLPWHRRAPHKANHCLGGACASVFSAWLCHPKYPNVMPASFNTKGHGIMPGWFFILASLPFQSLHWKSFIYPSVHLSLSLSHAHLTLVAWPCQLICVSIHLQLPPPNSKPN